MTETNPRTGSRQAAADTDTPSGAGTLRERALAAYAAQAAERAAAEREAAARARQYLTTTIARALRLELGVVLADDAVIEIREEMIASYTQPLAITIVEGLTVGCAGDVDEGWWRLWIRENVRGWLHLAASDEPYQDALLRLGQLLTVAEHEEVGDD